MNFEINGVILVLNLVPNRKPSLTNSTKTKDILKGSRRWKKNAILNTLSIKLKQEVKLQFQNFASSVGFSTTIECKYECVFAITS